MFACLPCQLLFPSLGRGITHILQDPVHAAAILPYTIDEGLLGTRRHARSLITHLTEQSTAEVEDAKLQCEANDLVSSAIGLRNNQRFRRAMREVMNSPIPENRDMVIEPAPQVGPPAPPPAAPVTYRVFLPNPARYAVNVIAAHDEGYFFIYTYQPGDMATARSLRCAVAAAYVASGGPELRWGQMCKTRWVVIACGVGKQRVLVKLSRAGGDVGIVKRNAEVRGDGWVRLMEIG